MRQSAGQRPACCALPGPRTGLRPSGASAILAHLQETAQHGEVQGLAKAAGTGDEQDLGSSIQGFLNEQGFVNKEQAVCTEFAKIADPKANARWCVLVVVIMSVLR